MSKRDQEIGTRLRDARKKEGLTQKELGKAIGRTESSISEYEKGSVEMPRSVLENIAKALSVDVNYLLNGTQPEQIKQLGESVGRLTEAMLKNTLTKNYNLLNQEGKLNLVEHSNILVNHPQLQDVEAIEKWNAAVEAEPQKKRSIRVK